MGDVVRRGPAATLNQRDDRRLILAAMHMRLALRRVLIGFLTAGVILVRLDDLAGSADIAKNPSFLRRLADAMCEEPCGFERDIKSAVQLFGANALLVRC